MMLATADLMKQAEAAYITPPNGCEVAESPNLRAILPRESELSWECHAARFLKHGSKRT